MRGHEYGVMSMLIGRGKHCPFSAIQLCNPCVLISNIAPLYTAQRKATTYWTE